MTPPDGGAAFPRPHQIIDANDPLFKFGDKGMSLRQHYAGLAMQGFCANPWLSKVLTDAGFSPEMVRNAFSERAFTQADSMLAESTKEHP